LKRWHVGGIIGLAFTAVPCCNVSPSGDANGVDYWHMLLSDFHGVYTEGLVGVVAEVDADDVFDIEVVINEDPTSCFGHDVELDYIAPK